MSLPFAVPAHWQIVPFGDLVHDSAFGPRFGAEHYAKDGNIATLRIMDISDDGVISYSVMPFARLPEEKFSNHFLKENDLVIARTGVTCGTAAVFGQWHSPVVPGAFLIRFRLTPTVVPKYYCYFFNLSRGRKHLLSVSSGACQTNLNITNVKRLAVPLPPLEEQNAVVNFLSSYDDLIENNARRITILEEMAQMIYREWFVNFRFPGHERVKMVESEMGQIPRGWTVKTVAELCNFVARGVTPQYQKGSGRYIINQKANRGAEIDMAELKELDPEQLVPEDKLARYGDVLVNCLGEGTLGRVHYFTGPNKTWAVDQHMTICRADDPALTGYVYMNLSSAEGQAQIQTLKTGGTNMTMFNISALRAYQLLTPDCSLLRSYYQLVEPSWKLRQNLQAMIWNLRSTRDLILPKLISGEIDAGKFTFQSIDTAGCASRDL